jgi:hypothetical protein
MPRKFIKKGGFTTKGAAQIYAKKYGGKVVKRQIGYDVEFNLKGGK